MSQATDSAVEVPEGQIYLNLRREEDKRLFAQTQQAIAEDVTNVDVFREVATEFLEVHRLRQDKRVREAIKIIAEDHDMQPENVSLNAAFKVLAGAYTGQQTTHDWHLENGEKI